MNSLAPKRKQAFSLVEVSLSLAIIGIAFTVIIGMLPVGLRQSRAATDTTNEARILAAMTSTLYATEYNKLDGPNGISGKLYYFDSDGAFLEMEPSEDYKDQRVYQALFLPSNQPLPGGDGELDKARVGKRVHVIYGRANKAASDALTKLATADEAATEIAALGKGSAIKVMPIVVVKMDRIEPKDL